MLSAGKRCFPGVGASMRPPYAGGKDAEAREMAEAQWQQPSSLSASWAFMGAIPEGLRTSSTRLSGVDP